MLQPRSTAELADNLKEFAADGRSIETGGAFSKRTMGGPAVDPPAAVTISTAAMTRVLEYEPNDLTISVEAGLKWKDLQALLAANRQMVPMDPPFYDEATVGGVLAANTSGPRRRLYGSPRDVVIGMKFATLAGDVIQSGGMVVKNVAGLDMGKLLIGSFGTLGVIGEANFKLAPVPPASATFLQQADSLDAVVSLRNRILTGVLQPAAIDILHAPSIRAGWTLALGVGATERVVERYRRELAGAELLEREAESAFWRSVREFAPAWMAAHPGGAVVRLSVALQDVGAALASLPGPSVTRAGNGVIYAGFEDAAQAAAYVKAAPHQAVVEMAAPGSRIERWPRPGSGFGVMEQIKNMLDPSHLLNRGRLYGRI